MINGQTQRRRQNNLPTRPGVVRYVRHGESENEENKTQSFRVACKEF